MDHYNVQQEHVSPVMLHCNGVVDPLSGLEDKGTVLQVPTCNRHSHNKFYSFQIIIDNDDGHQAYVFFRWGRVGAKNPQVKCAPFPINQTLHVILLQRKLHGPFTKDAAKELFVSKFTAKTENDWPVTPPFEPVKGKYTLIGKLSKSHLAKGYVILDFISDTLTTIADLNAASKQVEATSSTPRHRRRSSRVIKSTASSTTKAQLAKCKAQLKDWTSDDVALGTPVHVLDAQEYSFEALQKLKCHSLLGVGRMAPSEATHETSYEFALKSVRLRYAVTVTFEFN
ncbi:hypothetical protein DYB35_010979 [Aphanomyces astaci]|uniref:NAD(+) ADP-ribosyltransferase n=1 Tax=Aphanomyces astaci TaxID=112090 RepID=A0A418DAP1_APHAT|nr:hypothetical protein DYB35_010979 [Aphanomyces astaci]